MAKTPQDFTKILQDTWASLPLDTTKFQEAFKSQSELSERFTKVALDAAEKSTEITSKWAKDSIARLGTLAEQKDEPAAYAKALSEFASSSAEIAAENLAAFAEVAKKVQMETVELMLAAGKDFSEDASAAVKKATAEVSAAAKKTTPPTSTK
ncbi:phasin family protein [Paenirhodobacter populi]|uniref:Phasin n=1 Tax=Paenirhodobacter populi TaxID=2306993 RepID=A0A443J239_9RHOB|nr:Phasin [Sinirhodobacter populi]RWR08377.1 Phasin [Sinirhodobacter populi]RWR14502.1 Phasin [Sinirhodobacter populi]RWR22216.1 Phasin [Sinirhodobacter populi]RWR32100.1 Phasin [Sinirhodobacter populi]RWR33900.1 Phasin [Sinirhodobacter populi]